MDDVADLGVVKKRNNMTCERAMRSDSLTPARFHLIMMQIQEERIQTPLSLGMEKATTLRMDHIFVKFADFLWAYTFIGPFLYNIKGGPFYCSFVSGCRSMASLIHKPSVITELLLPLSAWSRHNVFISVLRRWRRAANKATQQVSMAIYSRMQAYSFCDIFLINSFSFRLYQLSLRQQQLWISDSRSIRSEYWSQYQEIREGEAWWRSS